MAHQNVGGVDEVMGRFESVCSLSEEELRLLLASDDVQSLPRSVESSLEELDRTLRSVHALAQTLEEQPNALIFPREQVKDPVPPAGTR